MIRSLLLCISFLCIVPQVLPQSPSQRASVLLSATVQNNPPRITLAWEPFSGTNSITIFRKLKTETSWGSAIASPGASSTQYQDNSVQVGITYEYKVVRSASSGTGTGYIASGIEVPMTDYRGKMILLVDNTLAPQMVTELNQLTQDLKADGWWVLRSDVSRTAPASSIRSIIMGHYNSDPVNVKAVYIVGHVPVPYSGNQAPDGHSEHVGAWPCDGYYGEMTSTWTDNTVNNNSSQRQANRNIPGDGKFDQSTYPSDIELQVGRVDLYDMPAFSQSEVQLVKNYLNRAHSFKIKGWTPLMRGLMFDNLQWVSNPIGASGLRNMGPLAGPANITQANQNGTAFHNLVNGESYLWTYSSGGGGQLVTDGVLTFNGANNVGTTQAYAGNSSMGGVFNMSCGSYFGDWDNKNNFLRAPIAKGDALTSVWAGIPAWYFHHMGMGDNIGFSTLVTMNNTGLYAPITEGWQGSIGKVHLALHGDPSLRMQMVAPPTSLSVSNANGTASFNWSASSETVLGYHIYKFHTNGTISRLTTSPVTGTSYQNAAIPFEAGREYMVRAVKLQVNHSGSYFNLSLGALATAAGSATADCQGVVGGGAVPGSPCNDNDPCTVNDTWNSNCQCVGTPATITASITAAGPTNFCAGGNVVLNANTGSGYTYVWRRDGNTINGATSASYTADQAGVYTVRVSNGGCEATSSGVTVTINSAPQAAISAAGPTSFCAGGSVQLNANTGSGLSYTWRRDGNTISGATSANYTADQAGVYTVRVNNGGCETTSSGITVTIQSTPVATITPAGPTSFCSGGSVVLNANTGSGLSYVWRRDGTVISGANSTSYTADIAGAYSVQVSNGSCDVTSSSVAVTIGAAPSATITPAGPTTFCTGGSVVLNANTGSGLSYIWRRDGNTIAGATEASFTANVPGVYTVRVTNAGCETTSQGVTVAINSTPVASITPSGPTSFCIGGSVVLNATTGSGLSYVWRRDGNIISGATAPSYTADMAGTYSVQLNNGSCTATSPTISVTINTPPTAVITPAGATSICSGGSVVLNANTGSGFTYVWRLNGSPISGATNASYTAGQAGVYSVQVTNGNCTTTSSSVTVAMEQSPVATLTSSGGADFCTGGSMLLSASTGTGLTYVWRHNGLVIQGATSSNYTATLSGNYTVEVSNGSCTSVSQELNVTIAPGPTAAITLNGQSNFCSGASVVLNANEVTGVSYSWQLNGQPISGASGSSYIATQAGTYTVTISGMGCEAVSLPVQLSTYQTDAPQLVLDGSGVICAGESVLVTTSPAEGATYLWSLNGDAMPGNTGAEFIADQAGVVSLQLIQGDCISAAGEIEIMLADLPEVAITSLGPTSVCTGDTVLLQATENSAYTYSWSINGVVIMDAVGHLYPAVQPGLYSVIADNGECSGVAAAVEVSMMPDIAVVTSGPTAFCEGDSVMITAIADPGYTYTWSVDGVVLSDETTESFTAHASGSYMVTIESASCSASSIPVAVEVSEVPTALIEAVGSLLFCAGDSVMLQTMYDPSWTYQWNHEGTAIEGANGNGIAAHMNGAYSVDVTNGGCTVNSGPVIATTLPIATLALSGPASFCEGDSVVINALASDDHTYTWYLDGAILPGDTTHSLVAAISGAYHVTISDGECTADSDVISIGASPEPVFDTWALGSTIFCNGDSVLLAVTSDAAYEIQWTLDGVALDNAAQDTLVASVAGMYSPIVFNEGCGISGDTITVMTLPVVALSVQGNTIFCEGSQVMLSTVLDSGYSYQWILDGEELSDGTGHQLAASSPGTYSVYVDGDGCSAASDTVTLEMLPAPEINCYADVSMGMVGVDVLSGIGPFTYMWNEDATQDTSFTTVNSSGLQVVLVTDANGCSETCEVMVNMGDEDDLCIGLRTEVQAYWPGSNILYEGFSSAFPDGLTIGCGFRTLTLTDAGAVAAFLPSEGPSLRLPFGSMVDPGDLYGNTLAGELVALKLSVRFDEMYEDFSTTDQMLSDAVVAIGPLQGMTVAEVIDEADKKIGGCFSIFSRNQLRIAISNINNGYSGGAMASGFLECEEAKPIGRPVYQPHEELAELGFNVTTIAYPNPFTEYTTIVVGELERRERIVIEVLTTDGVVIAKIFEGEVAAGVETHAIWHASSHAMGVYYYRVSGSKELMTGRLILQ